MKELSDVRLCVPLFHLSGSLRVCLLRCPIFGINTRHSTVSSGFHAPSDNFQIQASEGLLSLKRVIKNKSISFKRDSISSASISVGSLFRRASHNSGEETSFVQFVHSDAGRSKHVFGPDCPLMVSNKKTAVSFGEFF